MKEMLYFKVVKENLSDDTGAESWKMKGYW